MGFKSQTPQGDGNEKIKKLKAEIADLVSNHKPRKGTETGASGASEGA